MTQLERELQTELRIQRELFRQELERVTSRYDSNLTNAMNGYQKIINDQKSIIDQQSRTLERYSNVTQSMQISIDEEQLQALKSSHTKLMLRLDALEQSDKDLEQQLSAVLREL